MKIVDNSVTQKNAKEIYKVGNVINDGLEYYLVVASNEGYALVSLSSNTLLMEKESLSELAEAAQDDGDRLVDAELRILE